MKKYLVTIEFRYNDKGDFGGNLSKTVTIGVYDSFDDAILSGNVLLELLESKFKRNPNYKSPERFSKNGGCFGLPRTLVPNLGYLQTPFSFFAQITTLHYDDVAQVIAEVMEACNRYKTQEEENF